jgi:23S rRNA (cytosine1962-C5)-methyltransferase
LLLHAAALELPGLGRRFEAGVPPIFGRYLQGSERALGERPELRARLLDAACFRAPLAATTGVLRWVNGEADELYGLVVDLYGRHATLAVESEEANARAPELSELLVSLGVEGVYLKRRVRADLRRVESASLAPSAPVLGRPLEHPVVDEAGIRFRVELGQGLSTGLFVDQRDNRGRVRELSGGREVLNLFSYSCSFSVAAALGGARRVTSVDTSARALARGVENFRLNGLDPEKHGFVRQDAIEYLERAARRGARFDLIVLDPPSFATRDKSKVFSVGRDYAELATRVLAVLAPSGSLLAVTNHRKTRASTLRRILIDIAEGMGRTVRRAKILPSGLDCRDAWHGPEPSKSVLLTLGS